MKQTNISKLRSQAVKALRAQQAFGSKRIDTKRKDGTSSGIHSVRTWNETINALAYAADAMGLYRLKQMDYRICIDYLVNRVSVGMSDKSVSRERVALERLLGRKLPSYQNLKEMQNNPAKIDLWLAASIYFLTQSSGNPNTPLGKRERFNSLPKKSGIGTRKTTISRPGDDKRRLKEISRAYTDDQIKSIANSFEQERERLAIILMRDAGLRVHELYTLRRVGEGKPVSNQRDWVNERFIHRDDGVKYIVTGKGGLTREVMISKPLADRLEKLRHGKPVKVNDRGVIYRQRYNLLAGNNLSKRFSEHSKQELGFSTGAHGARHSYVQARYNYLVYKGIDPRTAKKIVSQEVGHMRASITNTYLR